MPITLDTPVVLAPYSTFRIGGPAAGFAQLTALEEVPLIRETAARQNLPLFILGGGSNTIFTDGPVSRFIVQVGLRGRTVLEERGETVLVEAAAGESWDELVAWTVAEGWSGLEALSAIPGTVGAAPVQNIGAYGAEFSRVVREVIVIDLETGRPQSFSRADCGFAYRDSLFKRQAPGRFLITAVRLELGRSAPQIPDYPSARKYFTERGLEHPSLAQIREGITAIRWSKLPNPALVPNCGSFFENPIVTHTQAAELAATYPEIPIFPYDDGHQKIAAGWLIDQAGLKGKDFGRVGTYDKNALVLVNRGGATFADVTQAVTTIVTAVKEKFGIVLELEPNLIS